MCICVYVFVFVCYECMHFISPGMFTIFLSHQWLGRKHPDPTGVQLGVFKEVLRQVINGSLRIENDMISQMQTQSISANKAIHCLATGFVFLDWFAIPQVTARAAGVNEAETKSCAARAVQSIPFYVEARRPHEDFFFLSSHF